MTMRFITKRERIESNIERSANGCWIWTGKVDRYGYGAVRIDRGVKWHIAHRVAYQVFVGPIPEGLELDHLCRVRACVNPEHLEPVTHKENSRRMHAARTAERSAA